VRFTFGKTSLASSYVYFCHSIFVLTVKVCFYCVWFGFFSTKPRHWLGRTSPKWPIACRVGRKSLQYLLTQSSSEWWIGYSRCSIADWWITVVNASVYFICSAWRALVAAACPRTRQLAVLVCCDVATWRRLSIRGFTMTTTRESTAVGTDSKACYWETCCG